MPFETFDIYSAGYCLMRGHMPKCVPAPGNRFKFVFPETARAVAAEFDATEFASFADACRRLKRMMFTAPQHDTTPHTEDHPHHVSPRPSR
jgi:hypothetical protein